MPKDCNLIAQRIISFLLICGLSLSVSAGMTDTAPDSQSEPVQQPDPASDTQMIEQSGNVMGYMSLPVGDDVVEATYLPDGLGENYGKILILPGENDYFASVGLVNTLRFGLSKAGWSVMTLALSYPEPEAKVLLSTNAASEAIALPETPDDQASTETSKTDVTVPKVDAADQETDEDKADINQVRIASALAYLQAQETSGPTVILAIGEAASYANEVIAQIGQQRALIWIAPQMAITQPPAVHQILDIVPGLDAMALSEAQRRRISLKQMNVGGYAQSVLPTAAKNFIGYDQEVLLRIRAWLYRHYVKKDP
jgi:hypothetical protein